MGLFLIMNRQNMVLQCTTMRKSSIAYDTFMFLLFWPRASQAVLEVSFFSSSCWEFHFASFRIMSYCTGSPCNSRFLGEMEIRELQNREFQGPPIFGSRCPLTLYYFLFIMLIGNYLSISFEKVAIFSIFNSKKLGVIAKCGHFEGFKKPRIANPRNSRPRIARTPCIQEKNKLESLAKTRLNTL